MPMRATEELHPELKRLRPADGPLPGGATQQGCSSESKLSTPAPGVLVLDCRVTRAVCAVLHCQRRKHYFDLKFLN